MHFITTFAGVKDCSLSPASLQAGSGGLIKGHESLGQNCSTYHPFISPMGLGSLDSILRYLATLPTMNLQKQIQDLRLVFLNSV